jgi:pyruvate dehydrogenase E2 component (dihydrolipoamide acetyltransferase)
MHTFMLPDPGEGLTEAEIVSWKVGVGDIVAVNDVLLEIETSKSLVELPSPYAGVVTELLVAEGDLVPIGTPIIRIAEAGELDGVGDGSITVQGTVSGPVQDGSVSDGDASSGSAAVNGGTVPISERVNGNGTVPISEHGSAAARSAQQPSAMLVGYGAKAGAVARRARRGGGVVAVPETDQVQESYDTSNPVSRHTDDVTPSDRLEDEASGEHLPPPGRPAAATAGNGRAKAKPAVRRVARDLGVDLGLISGTGPDGLITAEDVVAAASGGSQKPAGDRRLPLRGIRREMFRSMTASLAVPQATAMIEADVSGTVQLLDTLRKRREFTDLRVSPLLVFARAACLAISQIPEINAGYDADADEIVLHGAVNLGIAAATPRGLLVPNIKNAERMNLTELAQALNAMVAVAREGRVQPYDLAGGTFTITNIGVFGVDSGTPILSPGESAIMCLGTIRRKPWVVGSGEDERIEPRSVCTVSLTFDHRIVDGEMASRFLAEVAAIMSNPGLALMF